MVSSVHLETSSCGNCPQLWTALSKYFKLNGPYESVDGAPGTCLRQMQIASKQKTSVFIWWIFGAMAPLSIVNMYGRVVEMKMNIHSDFIHFDMRDLKTSLLLFYTEPSDTQHFQHSTNFHSFFENNAICLASPKIKFK